jgi:hypothetical protein
MQVTQAAARIRRFRTVMWDLLITYLLRTSYE